MSEMLPAFTSPTLAGAGALAAVASTGVPHGFQQVAVKQLMDNWCWAAVGSAVRFCAGPLPQLSQCEVGNLVKYRLYSADAAALDWCSDRQSDSLPTAMNKQTDMITVLQQIAAPIRPEADWPCYARIRAWVSNQSQVCPLLVRLLGGVQHFILVIGTTPDGIVIYDPSERMQGSGHITRLTEPAVAAYGGGQCLKAYFV